MPVDQAPDLELPAAFIRVRDVEMNEEIVQPGRRYFVTQRLERHAAVARRERDLLGGEAARD